MSGRLCSSLGLILLCLCLMSGCVTVRFVERGERYEQGGQEELALATYKQVLEADPHNTRALDGYARVCERMLERWRQQIEIARDRADYARALELAAHARQSLPEHPPAAALERKVRAQVLGLEAQRAERGDYAGALKIANQIAAFELRDNVQAHARVLLLQQRWAASLDVQSDRALIQGHLALAALYALKAESLEASPQRAQRAHQRLEALTARYAARVSIEGTPALTMPGLIPGLCLQQARAEATLRLRYTRVVSSCQAQEQGQRRCELLWTSTLSTMERVKQPTILSRTLTIYEPSPAPQQREPSPQELAALMGALHQAVNMALVVHQGELLSGALVKAQGAGLEGVEALAAAALFGPLSQAEREQLASRAGLEGASIILRHGLQDRWSSVGCKASIQ